MKEFELRETPDYDEIIERFGDRVTMDEAVEKTAYLQKKYPELTAIGSVLASEQIYGQKNLRNTTQALDFAAPKETIESMAENYPERWVYDASYVFSTNEELDEEWMVAVIPCNEPVFSDDELNGFSIDYHDIETSNNVETDFGEISTFSPEIGLTSKLRRYMMQKKNRDNFKESDLVDIANIILSQQQNKLDLDTNILNNYINTYIGEHPDDNQFRHDIAKSIHNSEKDNELDIKEIEDILRGTKETF